MWNICCNFARFFARDARKRLTDCLTFNGRLDPRGLEELDKLDKLDELEELDKLD